MTGIDTFRIFWAIKLHFNGSYDAHKYNFNIAKGMLRKFAHKKDRYFYERLGAKFNDPEDLKKCIVQNFLVKDNCWIGDVDDAAGEALSARLSGFNYQLKKDLKVLLIPPPELPGATPEEVFNSLLSTRFRGNSVVILDALASKKVSIETVTCIDILVGFIRNIRKQISDPLGINDQTFKLIESYKPFLLNWTNCAKAKQTIISCLQVAQSVV